MSTGVWVKGKRIRKNRRVAKRPQSMRLTKVEVVNDISQKRSVEHEDVIAEKDEERVNEFFSQSSPVGMVSGSRALHMEGEMEKKSPAHNLWQSRYFKLMTKQRESDSGEMSNIYNLMWYKKKGGSVIKTLSSESIAGLMVMSSPTSMVYSPQDHTLHKGDAGISSTIPIKLKDVSENLFLQGLLCKIMCLFQRGRMMVTITPSCYNAKLGQVGAEVVTKTLFFVSTALLS